MLVSGLFAVPENVIMSGFTQYGKSMDWTNRYASARTLESTAYLPNLNMTLQEARKQGLNIEGQPVTYDCDMVPVSGLNAFVPAQRRNTLNGLGSCGSSPDDCSCGCSSHGLGDLSESIGQVTETLAQPVLGFPLWAVLGVAGLVLMFASSRGGEASGYRAAKAAARARYYRDLKDADEDHGRRYKRYGRAAIAPLEGTLF